MAVQGALYEKWQQIILVILGGILIVALAGLTVWPGLRHFTGLPPFPFAPLILFWGEQEAGFDSSEIDATKWIGQISPRPVLLMQGGADTIISVSSGEWLYAAAGEPKELWYEPAIGHTMFDEDLPQEYEQRVIDFFDAYLQDQ